MRVFFGKLLGLNEFEKDCWSSYTTITFPSKVRIIGKGAFYNFDKLESIKIPFGVKVIEDSAFESCVALHRVIFEHGAMLTKINKRAFYKCENLINIELPLSVKTIGERAFGKCIELQTVTFEEDSYLDSIGDKAFKGCTYLSSIVIPKNVTKMGKDVFADCPNVTIFCECDEKPDSWPYGWNNGHEVIWGCKRIEEGYYSLIYGEKSNKTYAYIDKFDQHQVTNFKAPETINGKEYISRGLNMSLFCDNEIIKSVVLPTGVTSIGHQTFRNCKYLRVLTIPSGFKKFGSTYALIYCKHLIEVINESDVEIPAIEDCEYVVNGKEESRLSITKDGFVLRKIIDEEGMEFVGYIGNNNDVAIPNNVTSIGSDAFWGSNIKSVFIPLSVNFISELVFMFLETIKYEGTIKEWEKINKEKYWNSGSSVTYVTCKDGKVKIKEEE